MRIAQFQGENTGTGTRYRVRLSLFSECSLFPEQVFECLPGIYGSNRGRLALYRNARREVFAVVFDILTNNTQGDRLSALQARFGVEESTLTATVDFCAALWALASDIQTVGALR